MAQNFTGNDFARSKFYEILQLIKVEKLYIFININ